MNLRERGYEIEFTQGSILPFEERVIASGLCDVVVPMTFYDARDSQIARYDCSGYIVVEEMSNMTMEKVFEIFEKTLSTLSKAREFYLDANKMKLSLETVFYHMKRRHVRIAYIPEEAEDIFDKIERYSQQLASLAGEETEEYISKIVNNMKNCNYNLKDMKMYLKEQKNLIYGII